MQNEEIVQEVIEDEMAVEDEVKQVPADEWTVAALAHATVLLTLVLGVAGGIGALIGPAVALAIYFGYRERSRFAAFHALQSCAYQVAGVLLYLVFTAVMVVWLVIAWTISGLLSAVLVGLLMMPFALLLTLLVVLLLICIPFAWLSYGLYASYQVYQGRDFRYRWIGEWVEREVKF
jgi:uncharacterized Tic20 family protein